MAGEAFKRTFPGAPVEASGVMLRSYSGHLAQVESQAQVSVRLGDRKATLYLTKEPSPTLLGRNWIQALGVRLPEYQEAVRAVEDVPNLLTKFKALFQPGREMNNLFRGMRHVVVYLDDFLVTSKDDEDHLQNLQSVLARLQDAGLKLKLEKCIFLAPSVEYLGHVISLAGLVSALRKVEAVLKAPKGPEQERAAELPRPHQLLQDLPAEPVVASAATPSSASRWTAVGLEEGRGLDLPAQLGAYHQCSSAVQASPRVVRWALKLAAYSYRLVYRPGKDLAPADALSRLLLPEVPAAVPEPAEVFMLEHAYPEVLSRRAVSQATSRDPVLSQVVKVVSRGKELAERMYSHKSAELSLQQGCLLWGSRVGIPQSLRFMVLQLLHVGHQSVEKTKMVARFHVWWPGLVQDIAHMVQSCQVCQENQRASRHVEITPWPFQEKPWSHLHVDFGSPFKGHYFLVVVDAFSKKPAGRGAKCSDRCQHSTRGGCCSHNCDAACKSGDTSKAGRQCDSDAGTPDAATPATPVLRRSARYRRPPDRYLPDEQVFVFVWTNKLGGPLRAAEAAATEDLTTMGRSFRSPTKTVVSPSLQPVAYAKGFEPSVVSNGTTKNSSAPHIGTGSCSSTPCTCGSSWEAQHVQKLASIAIKQGSEETTLALTDLPSYYPVRPLPNVTADAYQHTGEEGLSLKSEVATGSAVVIVEEGDEASVSFS
ncbi:hypothetical protein MRX96_049222 [Rhipicephalus microplus]